MIYRDAHRIIVQGPVTVDNVVDVMRRGTALFDGHASIIDLAEVTEVDSAIISMMLEWLRTTHRIGHRLQFANLPESLKSLIQLYGVAQLIPVSLDPVTHQNIT